jgi:hypothetical protein
MHEARFPLIGALVGMPKLVVLDALRRHSRRNFHGARGAAVFHACQRRSARLFDLTFYGDRPSRTPA